MSQKDNQTGKVLEMQKMKILMVLKILWDETDDMAGDESLDEETRAKHSLNREEIVERLKKQHRGISFNVKGVVNDLDQLAAFFDSIGKQTGGMELGRFQRTIGHREFRYYIANRPFSVTDIQMLMDSVDRMRFIKNSNRKTLKDKLKSLAGVKIWKSIKNIGFDEEEFYTVDLETEQNIESIQQAISENRIVTFRYFKWVRINGRIEKSYDARSQRSVSPWKLLYSNGYYYLIAYDKNDDKIKHYRVDKMTSVKKTRYKREGADAYKTIKIDEYCKKMFNMYAGKDTTVHMLIKPEKAEVMTNIIVDRFGSGVKLIQLNDGSIEVIEKISISRQFYAWLFGLGEGIEIIKPEAARKEMLKYASEIIDIYKN